MGLTSTRICRNIIETWTAIMQFCEKSNAKRIIANTWKNDQYNSMGKSKGRGAARCRSASKGIVRFDCIFIVSWVHCGTIIIGFEYKRKASLNGSNVDDAAHKSGRSEADKVSLRHRSRLCDRIINIAEWIHDACTRNKNDFSLRPLECQKLTRQLHSAHYFGVARLVFNSDINR